MKQLNYLIVSVLLVLLPLSAFTQIFGTEGDSARRWRIRFELDGGIKPLYFSERDLYEGEYQRSRYDWIWQRWDTTRTNLTDFNKVNVLRLGILVNLYDNLYVGFSYHPLVIRGFTISGGNAFYSSRILVALAGVAGYEYPFPLWKRLSINPSISWGTYQGDAYYEGLGNEYFGEGRLGLAVRLRKSGQARLWMAYGGYGYRENTPSYVFPDDRIVKTDFRYLSLGLGYVVNLNIRESREETEVRRKKRN